MKNFNTHRGFTLFEAGATLAVIAILGGISVASFKSAQENTPSTSNEARLTTIQAAGRSVVALSASVVPDEIASLIPGTGLKVVNGPSMSSDQISVAKLSATVVAYAVVNESGCVALVDDISSDTSTWVNDEATATGNCDAARIGLSTPSGGDTYASAVTFDFDNVATPPGAPAAPSVAVIGTGAKATFYAPRNIGGSPIIEYTVACSSAGTGTAVEATGESSPVTVTGLAAGQEYSCTVKAANTRGYGPYSEPSDSFVPVNLPSAPATASAVASDAQIAVTWSAVSSTATSPVSGYRVYVNDALGCEVPSPTTTACTVTGLTNGTAYSVQVRAFYGASEGSASPVASATPRTLPGVPSSVAATLVYTAGSSVVSVAFSAPSSDGGAAITAYRATCTSSNGGTTQSASGASSPLAVSSLSPGFAYTCTVAASNAAGFGGESPSSAAVTVYDTPSAPTGLAATPGNTQVTLTWTAMSSTAAAPVSGYRVYYAGPTLACTAVGAASTSCTASGLANGVALSFQVLAYNAMTEGALSTAVTATPRTVPTAPPITSATASTTGVSIAFSSPSSNGGSVVTGFTGTCTSTDGGGTVSRTVEDSPVSIPLTNNGYTYSCVMYATNAAGTSPASAAKTLTPSQGSTVSGYTCPNGGTPTGSTCNVPASGYVSTYYVQDIACPGSWGTYLSTYAMFGATLSGPQYTAWDGYCYTAIFYNYKSAGGTCWSTTTGAAANGSNKGVCSTSGLYKYIHQDYYSGNNAYGYCSSGGTLSGGYCYPHYPDQGYYSVPASSYAGSPSYSYYWDGWTTS